MEVLRSQFPSIVHQVKTKRMESNCKFGGNPHTCICDISKINVPEEVKITSKLVGQLFNCKVMVDLKNRKRIAKQIKKRDLAAEDLWPVGIQKIFIPGDIKITPRLLKQIFKDSPLVDVKKMDSLV